MRTAYEPEPIREIPGDLREPETDALWLLWRHRRFLLRVFIATAILSAIISFLIASKFTSTAKVVPSETSNANSIMASLMSRSGGSGGFGMDAASLLGLKTPSAFYIEMLQSRTVQDALVNKFDLRTHYKKKYWVDARKRLASNTSIDEDKKSGVITISVTDVDRKLATDMVREYISQLNQLSGELNTSAAHREREFLEERLKQAKYDLDQSLLQLSEFSSKHSMMDAQNQGKSMMDAAAKLQGELIAQESQLKGLEQIYSDDTPRVRSLRASVNALRSQLKDMVGSYTDPSEAESSPAGPGQYPAIRTLPALGYRYSDLYRQSKINETIYEYLRQQYELARIQEVKELPVVRVMDPPAIPERKSSPKRSLIVLLSVLVSMSFASVWVIQKRKWDGLERNHPRRRLLTEIETEFKRWRTVRRAPLTRDE